MRVTQSRGPLAHVDLYVRQQPVGVRVGWIPADRRHREWKRTVGVTARPQCVTSKPCGVREGQGSVARIPTNGSVEGGRGHREESLLLRIVKDPIEVPRDRYPREERVRIDSRRRDGDDRSRAGQVAEK